MSLSRIVFSALIFAALLFSSQQALAQFTQQGPKLVGTGAVGSAEQGNSVALSADGSTAIVGAPDDNGALGAAWVFTRSNGTWTQQGGKLVGTGVVGTAEQGPVALSADGNTAIVGAPDDNYVPGNGNTGAASIFTRSNGVWTQQGSKLVGTGAVGGPVQGTSVSLSGDGNTAIVGGPLDNTEAGAAWVYTRSNGVWTQQGGKLVGSGAVGTFPRQGTSVSLSGDGNTAIMGGPGDNDPTGAAWVFTRNNGIWTQQGGKLVGTGAVGAPGQGVSVALSADGSTAVVGGTGDNAATGAAWVFTRSNGVWTQQGSKLVGSGAVGSANQGISVALSGNGNTLVVGGYGDNSYTGAAWVFIRSNGIWTQQGKLLGTGVAGSANQDQGISVALSGDGNTAIMGGPGDNDYAGAAWVFVQPLQVTPATEVTASGTQGGPFSPSSFNYTLSATSGSVIYSITTPGWLTASPKSGTVTTSGRTITFKINSSADKLVPNTYPGSISFSDTTTSQRSATLLATLIVSPKRFKIMVEASPKPKLPPVQSANH